MVLTAEQSLSHRGRLRRQNDRPLALEEAESSVSVPSGYHSVDAPIEPNYAAALPASSKGEVIVCPVEPPLLQETFGPDA